MRWKAKKIKAMLQLIQLKKTTRMSEIHNPKTNSLYSDYIAYRCQLALYNLWNLESTLSWEAFVEALHDSEKLRNTAKNVIKNALISFDPSLYDFEIPHGVQFFENEPQNDVIRAAQIFDEQEGEFFIHLFMLQTEISHLGYLTERQGLNYKWKQYIQYIMQNDLLRLKLIRAFQKALTDLDFERSWMLKNTSDT